MIENDIKSEKKYGSFKIVGMAEYYGNKPGVKLQCVNCGYILQRYRYINLKNGYSVPSCKCAGRNRVQDLYGQVIGNWTVIGKDDSKEKRQLIKCNKCGAVRQIYNNVLNSGESDERFPKLCKCDKDLAKAKKIQIERLAELRKIEAKNQINLEKYASIIGRNIHTFVVTELSSDGLQASLVCSNCGSKITVPSNRVANQATANRRIPKCRCDISKETDLKNLVGHRIFDDIVVGYNIEQKTDKKFERTVRVRCLSCGTERVVNNVWGVFKAYEVYINSLNVEEDQKLFFYKKCQCRPLAKQEDRVSKYKSFINKHIDGSRLTITDIFLEDNVLMCKAICDCGNIVDKIRLSTLLSKHTRQCGCLNIENQQSFHRYYDNKYIGKTFNGLEVLNIFQQRTGATLWTCKCTECQTIENINPKLLVERNWYIGCGCKPQKGAENNKKYNTKEVIGKDFGGGIVVSVNVDERGTTWWSMICPECEQRYTRQAYIAYNRPIGHCGCVNVQWGEAAVRNALKKYGVSFNTEVSFDGLVGIGNRRLRFDFVVHSNEKDLAIEFDGVQHYDPKAYKFINSTYDSLYSKEAFERQQKNDAIKDEYCRCNEIPLLRIRQSDVSYSKSKVDKIVRQFLVNNNIIKGD